MKSLNTRSDYGNKFGEPIIVNNSFGFITFAGPFNLVGIMDRPLGFYEPIIIGRNISSKWF